MSSSTSSHHGQCGKPAAANSLQIKSEAKLIPKLVSNILAQDKTKVSTTYSLLLENYVQRDIATIEIVAEAVDRHLPTPF